VEGGKIYGTQDSHSFEKTETELTPGKVAWLEHCGRLELRAVETSFSFGNIEFNSTSGKVGTLELRWYVGSLERWSLGTLIRGWAVENSLSFEKTEPKSTPGKVFRLERWVMSELRAVENSLSFENTEPKSTPGKVGRLGLRWYVGTLVC